MSQKLVKLLIVEVLSNDISDYDYSGIVNTIVDSEFIELPEDEANELVVACQFWNARHYNGRKFCVLRPQSKEDLGDVLAFYKQWKQLQAEQNKKRAEEAAKRKAANEAKAQEKKHKQLEKLKKELGET
jgi:hypothetical protein